MSAPIQSTPNTGPVLIEKGEREQITEKYTPVYHKKGVSSGGRTLPSDIISEYLQGAQEVTYGGALLRCAPESVSWFWGGVDSGLFPEGKLVGLASYSGEGKTTLMIHMLARAGGAFLGSPVAPFERALFLTETDEQQVQQILREAKPDNPDSIGFCFTNPTGEQLVDTLFVERPDVLVIDSLTSKGPGFGIHGEGRFDWFDATHTTRLQSFLRQIRRSFNLKTLIILLHTVKAQRDSEGNRIKSAPAIEDIRGSGGIAEQLDVAYVLRPSGEHRVGWLYRVKRRSSGVVEKVKFSYEEDKGRYNWHPTELSKEGIMEAIRNGNVSGNTIAAFLHFRKESVHELIAKMIEEGSLTETGAGKATELHIVENKTHG